MKNLEIKNLVKFTLSLLFSIALSEKVCAQRSGTQSDAPVSLGTAVAVPAAVSTTLGATPVPTPTPTVTPVSATATPPTIHQIATTSANNNSAGNAAMSALQSVLQIQAAGYCASQYTQQQCYLYMGGALLAGISKGNMNQARDQSNATAAAVEVPTWTDTPVNPLGKLPDGGPGTGGGAADGSTTAYASQLIKEGWKVNPKTGQVTTPKGKVLPVTPLSTPAQIKAAGLSDSVTQGLLKSNAELKAVFDKKLKSMQAGSAAGGPAAVGGGGSADGEGGLVKLSNPTEGKNPLDAGQKFGSAASRDPADVGVAGMKKDYFGQPIGVSADSLFDMVDRRYQLHEKQGSFLGPR